MNSAFLHKKFTIRTETNRCNGFLLLDLEHFLRLVADAVQLEQVVYSYNDQQVHIVWPVGWDHVWAHQFFELGQVTVGLVLVVHWGVKSLKFE